MKRLLETYTSGKEASISISRPLKHFQNLQYINLHFHHLFFFFLSTVNFISRTDRRTKNGSQRADRKYLYIPDLE